MTKVQKTRVRKWIAALRSGKYKQATRHLRVGKGRCCLGVACDVYKRETGKGGWKRHAGQLTFLEEGEVMPQPVYQWFGLESNPQVHGDNLAHHNDNGRTFKEIADWIEEALKLNEL